MHSLLLIQESHIGTPTPRRSRVSSIFQQKTIKPDDIDADFLKHVAFAAQRASPVSAASEAAASSESADGAAVSLPTTTQSLPLSLTLQSADRSPNPPADLQPADTDEFTLAKIEQSIAEIEAELGWTTDSAGSAAAAIDDATKAAKLPSGILTTAHSGRPHVGVSAVPAGNRMPAAELAYRHVIDNSYVL